MIPWESIAFFAVRGRMAFVALHSEREPPATGHPRLAPYYLGGRRDAPDIAHVLVERANVVLNEMGKPANVQFRDLRAPTGPR